MGGLSNLLVDWGAQIGGAIIVVFGFLLLISALRNPNEREDAAVTIGVVLIAVGGLLFGGDCIIGDWRSCQLVTIWDILMDRIVNAIRTGMIVRGIYAFISPILG